ncbi:complement C1r subcomponent-like [Halichoeres trimaculatus]|uniref:complement C1r subcomponent-like n=1 Tax=Halichoeres trimaculatus TaxID=147232 RepID=UPI003D9E9D95
MNNHHLSPPLSSSFSTSHHQPPLSSTSMHHLASTSASTAFCHHPRMPPPFMTFLVVLLHTPPSLMPSATLCHLPPPPPWSFAASSEAFHLFSHPLHPPSSWSSSICHLLCRPSPPSSLAFADVFSNLLHQPPLLSFTSSAVHHLHREKCPFPGNVTKGQVTPISDEYLYRNNISVHCDQGYKLMTDGGEIDSFSATCQSNGQWDLPLPECHIIDCGEPEHLLNGGVTFLSGFKNQYLSVVQYHCNGPFYSLMEGLTVNLTCEADRRWKSSNDTVVSATCIPVCGQPTEPLPYFKRIFGGSDAPENTIPWQVLIRVNGQRAAGMVIADRWVMTAASVLSHHGSTDTSIQIFMGGNDIEALISSPMYVSSVHIHPEYTNPNHYDYNNDIGLIKLQDRLTFNSSIMPLCLPAENATYTTGILGLVSGFGLIKTRNSKMITNKLHYVELPVVDQRICNKSFNELKVNLRNVPDLTNNMFCAGLPEGGKDSCQGDSGGPFAIWDGTGYWAGGIVSWGVDCGKKGTYGVYTRVSNYISWIKKTMQEN